MDLKVNDVSGVTQTQEVNQTKPTDDGFKFTLASAIDDAELKEKLSGLMDEITEQGKKISEHMDIRDMKKYRGLFPQVFQRELFGSPGTSTRLWFGKISG